MVFSDFSIGIFALSTLFSGELCRRTPKLLRYNPKDLSMQVRGDCKTEETHGKMVPVESRNAEVLKKNSKWAKRCSPGLFVAILSPTKRPKHLYEDCPGVARC
jgi:hypothetical protein